MPDHEVGVAEICRWKGGRAGAFSVSGDDSLRSQILFAIPAMDQRGLAGTWWVNPGRGGSVNYKKQDDAWAECWIALYDDWKAAAARGHDFGNHTLHHLGAATVEEADYQVGETARIIWQTNPRQRLQLFLRGGGTSWGISDEELARILVKYDCAPEGRGGGIECPTWECDPSAAEMIAHVDAAIQEGSWHYTAFHGIGPTAEWGGPVRGEAFIALLDTLARRRDQVWTSPFTRLYKYQQERNSARVDWLSIEKSALRGSLTCPLDPRLYDEPLTLRVSLPGGWERALLTQGNHHETVPVIKGVATFDALPGGGDILLQA